MKIKKIGVLFSAALAVVVSPVLGVTTSAVQANTNGAQRFIVTFGASIDEQDKASVRGVGAETVKELRLVNGLVVTAPNETVTRRLAGIAAPASPRADTDGNGSLSAPEVRTFLQVTADGLGATGRDVFYGYGIINAREAVAGL